MWLPQPELGRQERTHAKVLGHRLEPNSKSDQLILIFLGLFQVPLSQQPLIVWLGLPPPKFLKSPRLEATWPRSSCFCFGGQCQSGSARLTFTGPAWGNGKDTGAGFSSPCLHSISIPSFQCSSFSATHVFEHTEKWRKWSY